MEVLGTLSDFLCSPRKPKDVPVQNSMCLCNSSWQFADLRILKQFMMNFQGFFHLIPFEAFHHSARKMEHFQKEI